jgi:predicted RNA-binding protein with PUA-like domain
MRPEIDNATWWDALPRSRNGIKRFPCAPEQTELETGRDEEKALAALTPNRDTTQFKTRTKRMKTKEKIFSNRDSHAVFLHFTFAPFPAGASEAKSVTTHKSPLTSHRNRIRVEPMDTYYLLKTEPSEYSFADLQRDKKTEWDGVSNPVALRNIRGMTPGARLIIYETGDRRTAVGTATAISLDASNPKSPRLVIEVGKAISKPVSLAEIKANKLFADSPLVRQGRLSVVPLTSAQYKALVG